MKRSLLAIAMFAGGFWISVLMAESAAPSAAGGPAASSKPASVPASQLSPKEAADLKKAEARKAAEEYLARLVSLYLVDKWEDLGNELKNSPKFATGMSPDMVKQQEYIRTSLVIHRPKWWTNCRATGNCSFGVNIWGKNFTANYVHSDALGLSGSVLKDGQICTVVTWSPIMVDNPREIEEDWAKKHKITESDVAETIIWHELGHCYITNFLPLNHVLELYNNYPALFTHCQELYADLTALYHSGPKAHMALMQLRSYGLKRYTETEPHDRAAYGTGVLLLMSIMADPAKWPSVHFPPKLEEKNPELNLLRYVYRHIEPGWTLEEDRMLREAIKTFIFTKGEVVLRSKGTIELPNKLQFKLMTADDRENATKREAWWKDQYSRLISSGRVDKESLDPKEKEMTEEELRKAIKDSRGRPKATTQKSK